MKVLMLNGSPHDSGVNDLALREMEAIFKENDIQSVEGFYESNYIGLYSNYATARFTNYQVLMGEQANNKVLELGGIL